MQTKHGPKIALVTGGAKGYGAGISKALAESGYRVYITGRDERALEACAKSTGVEAIRADATSPSDWNNVFSHIIKNTGRLDVLVNNAGGAVRIAPADAQTDNDIEAGITLNLLAPLHGCKRAASVMKQQKSGTIVNISSVCSRHAWAGWGIYGAAKAGMENFAKSLYLELRPFGVRVTTVIPSWGATGFTDAAGLGPRDRETLEKCIHPDELGKLVSDVCNLPSHLCIQETIIWPMVQEVTPL